MFCCPIQRISWLLNSLTIDDAPATGEQSGCYLILKLPVFALALRCGVASRVDLPLIAALLAAPRTLFAPSA